MSDGIAQAGVIADALDAVMTECNEAHGWALCRNNRRCQRWINKKLDYLFDESTNLNGRRPRTDAL